MPVLVAVIAVAIAYLRLDNRRVIDVTIGTGPLVKPGDTITVHYASRLNESGKGWTI
jgi:hypothetical protein